jgi:RNA polymerase sigma-70 factor (ECF subfamily)
MTTGGQRSGNADHGLRPIVPRGEGVGRRIDETSPGLSDEDLVQRLAAGDADALGPLYGRYVRLVFSIATQSLDPSAAEDMVQEVFLVVWRKGGTFDPERGPFKAWLLEITHSRVLNELRRRSRRPRLLPDQGEDHLRLMEDPMPEPVESVVRGQRKEAIDEALSALPAEQQDALRLAFFSEMTHEQVAATTSVPLGTAKSRIRTGLRRLRTHLSPLLVGGVALVLVSGGVLYQQEYQAANRYSRALTQMTASDVQALRLLPVGTTPAEAHGVYRAHEGGDLAVLTVSYLPQLPSGRVYQGWERADGGAWRSLGIVPPATADGHALLLTEGADLGTPPREVMVTEESAGGATIPSARVVISWTAP